MRKQKALLSESCELAKKVRVELEKRLEETEKEKNRLASSVQEKLTELETLKTENDRIHAEQASFSQVSVFLGEEGGFLYTSTVEIEHLDKYY